jgi:hypothetical protein
MLASPCLGEEGKKALGWDRANWHSLDQAHSRWSGAAAGDHVARSRRGESLSTSSLLQAISYNVSRCRTRACGVGEAPSGECRAASTECYRKAYSFNADDAVGNPEAVVILHWILDNTKW